VVPDTEASITTNRLRKLFYYTNPEVCAEDKFENPSFGNDFIQVLFKYIEEEPNPTTIIPEPRQFPRKWLWPGAALLLFLAIAVAMWQWLDRPKYWEEDFNDVSVEGLKSRGWEILDYDSVAFSKQLKPGTLTTHTLWGDYWCAPLQPPIITNLLLKKINSKSGKITFKLVDFHPLQDYQQAGIFLLDKNRKRNHNIRITFAACVSCSRPRQSFQMVKREHGTAYEKTFLMSIWPDNSPPPKDTLTPLWVQVQFEQNKFRFYAHEWHETASFVEIGEFDFDFEPYYIAVGAFRGMTNGKGELNTSASIPAFFDYLKVEPLPE